MNVEVRTSAAFTLRTHRVAAGWAPDGVNFVAKRKKYGMEPLVIVLAVASTALTHTEKGGGDRSWLYPLYRVW